RVPHYELTLTALYTNRVPVTPVRGAGRPQAVFVMERMLDLAAERLGLDRVAIRARNLIQPREFPYDVGLVSRDASRRRYDSGNYPECLRRLTEAVGWDGFAAEQQRARAAGRSIGLGLALFVEDTGLGPYERVTVVPGDTAGVPYGVGTFGSRVAVLAGTSAAQASAEVRRKALAVAADR